MVAFAIVLANVLVSTVRAQQPFTLTVDGNPQITLGCTEKYVISTAPGAMVVINNVVWQWQQTAPCASAWSGLQSTQQTPQIESVEVYVGSFTVQAQVQYTNYTNPMNPVVMNTTLSVNVTVPKPDSIKLPNPASVNMALGQSEIFYFQVMCQGNPVCGINATVKENLTSRVRWGRPLRDLPGVGTSELLHISNSSFIADTKGFGMNNQLFWNALPVGYSVDSLKQQFILIIPNACGSTDTYVIPTVFTVTRTKLDNNNLNLTIQ